MTTSDLVQELRARGIVFWIDGDRLNCRGTKEPLTPKLLKALKRDKQEVIKQIKSSYQEPHLDIDGSIVIPFDSDPKYHWWQTGQSIKETHREKLEELAEHFAPWLYQGLHDYDWVDDLAYDQLREKISELEASRQLYYEELVEEMVHGSHRLQEQFARTLALKLALIYKETKFDS